MIGGFVGINFAFFPGTESTFSNCYALNVEVVSLDSGDQAVLGGFVGQVSANFIAKHCYVSAKVTGGKNPGAFVGMTADESMNCKYDGCFYNNELKELRHFLEETLNRMFFLGLSKEEAKTMIFKVMEGRKDWK